MRRVCAHGLQEKGSATRPHGRPRVGQEAEGARDSGRRRLRWFPPEGTGGQAGAVEDGGNTIRGSGRGRAASANAAGGRGRAGRGARPVQQPHSRGAGSGTAVCTWSSGLSRNWLLGEGGLSARCPRAQSNRKRKGIANTPCPQKAHTLTWAWTLPGRGSHALQPAAPLVDTQPLFPCVHRKGPLVPPGPEQAG